MVVMVHLTALLAVVLLCQAYVTAAQQQQQQLRNEQQPSNARGAAAAAAAGKADCPLACRNGGVCNPGDSLFGGEITSESANDNNLPLRKHSATPYCTCPQGFTGSLCEIEYVLCASANGTCRTTGEPCQREVDDAGMVFYHCECQLATSDYTVDPWFAKKVCTHFSTTFCGGKADTDRKSLGMESQGSYCANSGKCKEKDANASTTTTIVSDNRANQNDGITVAASSHHAGCICTADWMGAHCEIPVDPNSTVARNYYALQNASPSNNANTVTNALTVSALGSRGRGRTRLQKFLGYLSIVLLLVPLGFLAFFVYMGNQSPAAAGGRKRSNKPGINPYQALAQIILSRIYGGGGGGHMPVPTDEMDDEEYDENELHAMGLIGRPEYQDKPSRDQFSSTAVAPKPLRPPHAGFSPQSSLKTTNLQKQKQSPSPVTRLTVSPEARAGRVGGSSLKWTPRKPPPSSQRFHPPLRPDQQLRAGGANAPGAGLSPNEVARQKRQQQLQQRQQQQQQQQKQTSGGRSQLAAAPPRLLAAPAPKQLVRTPLLPPPRSSSSAVTGPMEVEMTPTKRSAAAATGAPAALPPPSARPAPKSSNLKSPDRSGSSNNSNPNKGHVQFNLPANVKQPERTVANNNRSNPNKIRRYIQLLLEEGVPIPERLLRQHGFTAALLASAASPPAQQQEQPNRQLSAGQSPPVPPVQPQPPVAVAPATPQELRYIQRLQEEGIPIPEHILRAKGLLGSVPPGPQELPPLPSRQQMQMMMQLQMQHSGPYRQQMPTAPPKQQMPTVPPKQQMPPSQPTQPGSLPMQPQQRPTQPSAPPRHAMQASSEPYGPPRQPALAPPPQQQAGPPRQLVQAPPRQQVQAPPRQQMQAPPRPQMQAPPRPPVLTQARQQVQQAPTGPQVPAPPRQQVQAHPRPQPTAQPPQKISQLPPAALSPHAPKQDTATSNGNRNPPIMNGNGHSHVHQPQLNSQK